MANVHSVLKLCLTNFIPDHPLPALRKVRRLVGLRSVAVRDAGRTTSVRRRGRGRAVRGHHRSQRLLPKVAFQRGQRNLQRIAHQESGTKLIVNDASLSTEV